MTSGEALLADLNKIISDIEKIPPAPKFYSSIHAVQRDGDRPLTVKRLWRDRLFTLPWTPWKPTRTIMVPNYKPVMYKIGNDIVYHPSLEPTVKRMGDYANSIQEPFPTNF